MLKMQVARYDAKSKNPATYGEVEPLAHVILTSNNKEDLTKYALLKWTIDKVNGDTYRLMPTLKHGYTLSLMYNSKARVILRKNLARAKDFFTLPPFCLTEVDVSSDSNGILTFKMPSNLVKPRKYRTLTNGVQKPEPAKIISPVAQEELAPPPKLLDIPESGYASLRESIKQINRIKDEFGDDLVLEVNKLGKLEGIVHYK